MDARRVMARGLATAIVASGLVGCVPEAPPAPTRLEITTNLYFCQGVIIDGVRLCFTDPRSSPVEVTRHGVVVASGVSDAQGRLVVEVPEGRFMIEVQSAYPEYEICPDVGVTAIAAQTVAVTHQCSFMAP